MSLGRYDEEWVAFQCCDCDPDIGEGSEYDKPCIVLIPEGDPSPKFCPRCESYLSMIDGDKGLRITNTPAERWVAKQEAERVAASDG